MPESEHSNAEPEPGRADAAAEARGETVKPKAGETDKPCSPAEAEANAKQTAQRAS